jgi:transposase-like protein
MSLRNVGDLLAERGIEIGHETVRLVVKADGRLRNALFFSC